MTKHLQFFVITTSVIVIWGAAKGAVGSHSVPSDAEEWLTTVTPEWVTLSQVRRGPSPSRLR